MSRSTPALSRALTVSVIALLVLAVAAPAWAHVTVRTDNPTAGGFAVYTVRVPNERDDAATTMIEVRMPDGFEASRYQPVEGWDIALQDGLLTISGGTIEPGQYRDFTFQARNPEQPGVLRFAAIQTYDSGEVVEWTRSEDSDTPAATVELVAGTEDDGQSGGHGDDTATETTAPVATNDPQPAEPSDDRGEADGSDEATSSPSPLTLLALALSVIAVALGGAAFARTARS